MNRIRLLPKNVYTYNRTRKLARRVDRTNKHKKKKLPSFAIFDEVCIKKSFKKRLKRNSFQCVSVIYRIFRFIRRKIKSSLLLHLNLSLVHHFPLHASHPRPRRYEPNTNTHLNTHNTNNVCIQ